MRMTVGIVLLALIAIQASADEHQDYLSALGMALPDSATGMLVFYDHGGERLLIREILYPVSLAQEPLCPDKIVIGDTTVRTGQHEAALLRKLGRTPRVIEDSNEKPADSSVVYFRLLILKQPNTHRFYTISPLQTLAGWFRVLEWDLPDSSWLRAYLYCPEKKGPYTVRLLELGLPRISPDSVSYAAGEPDLLLRRGHPTVEWDVGTDTVTIRR